jgi:hypothetical protein
MEIFAQKLSKTFPAKNTIKKIGYKSVGEEKRYIRNGGCMVNLFIVFTYGTREIKDRFYFEGKDELVFHSISIKTPEFMIKTYRKAINKKRITPEEFINMVTKSYEKEVFNN